MELTKQHARNRTSLFSSPGTSPQIAIRALKDYVLVYSLCLDFIILRLIQNPTPYMDVAQTLRVYFALSSHSSSPKPSSQLPPPWFNLELVLPLSFSSVEFAIGKSNS